MVHSRHGWLLPPPGAGTCRQPSPRTPDFRSPPGIHPLSVQPTAQVSSLRKAAAPRAMVLPRTLMPSERPQMAWSSPATVTGSLAA